MLGARLLYVEVVPSPQFITMSCDSVVNTDCDTVKVAEISEPEFLKVIVGAVIDGATLP